jgi:GWxTD domain-containing protein
MNMNISNSSLIILMAFLNILPLSLFAQVQKQPSSLYPTLDSQRESLYTEVRALHHASEDSMTIISLFRIQYDALIFEKSGSFRGEYVAFPSLEIEAKDSNGIIKARLQWKDSVFAANYEQTNSEVLYAFGLRAVTIPKNQYAIVLSLMDRGQIIKKVRISKIALQEFANPLFTSDNPFSETFRPDVFNENIPFSSRIQYAVFQLSSKIKNYSASLIRQRANEEYTKHVKSVASTRTELRSGTTIMPEFMEESASTRPIPLLIKESPGMNLLIVQFPDNVIAPGRYTLMLYHSEKKGMQDSIRFDFACQWEEMPKTLISAEYARQAMKYLLTDAEFDKMSGSTDLEIRKNIIDWWKKNDPTPSTIYDEPMAEYFRRADKAFTEFQTINESDGVMTQRGKIALLYGFPKEREMEIPSKGIKKEIWTYPSPINKRFVFQQESGKNFALIAIENIK